MFETHILRDQYRTGWHNGIVLPNSTLCLRIQDKQNEVAAHPPGLPILLAALMSVSNVPSPTSTNARAHLRAMAPYQIAIVGSQAIPINRDYKPLGIVGGQFGVPFVSYEPFLEAHGLGSGLNTAQLFCDDNPPWSSVTHRDQLVSRVLGWLDDNNL